MRVDGASPVDWPIVRPSATSAGVRLAMSERKIDGTAQFRESQEGDGTTAK